MRHHLGHLLEPLSLISQLLVATLPINVLHLGFRLSTRILSGHRLDILLQSLLLFGKCLHLMDCFEAISFCDLSIFNRLLEELVFVFGTIGNWLIDLVTSMQLFLQIWNLLVLILEFELEFTFLLTDFDCALLDRYCTLTQLMGIVLLRLCLHLLLLL